MDGGPRSIAARAPLAYAEPPTLEREEQEVPGNADSAGGRARVEWRIAPRTTVYANALAYRFTQDGTDPLGEGALAVHGYAGAEQRFESGLSAGLSAGLRDESNADGSDRLSFVQLVADAAVPIRPGLAVGLKWDHRSETKVLFEGPHAFVRGSGSIGLTVGRFTLSGLWGYSTEAEARPTHYPGAELRADLGARADLRLFGGRQAGGRVCVSGACRDVPPFEGARLDLTLRF